MTTKTAKQKLETKLAIELVRHFEKLAPFGARDRKDGKRDMNNEFVIGWQGKAIEIAQFIKHEYELPQSALSCKKRLLAELKNYPKTWLLDDVNYHKVNTILAHFRETLNLLFAEFQATVNEDYRGRVEARSADSSRIECDLTTWLNKANAILTKAASGANGDILKWEDVSCALALVTGRRMSEIHYSAEFVKVGEYEIEFTGQLKGKSRAVAGEKLIDHSFTIPTLVRADLCVSGLEWLEREGKRADRETGNPELVNKRWGKYLSRRAKAEWEIIKDEVWQEVDTADKWTFHKFRGLYFIACLNNLSEHTTFTTLKRLAPSILGDSDIKAVEPYERVDIKADSVTRI